MRRLLRPAHRFVLLSSLTTPITAFGQVPGTEAVLVQGQTAIPEAKTWYVDDDGNFVMITQQQIVELAQAPAPGTPLQVLSSAGSEGVTIPASMFKQIIMYSAGIGGLTGGVLVGGLMLTSSDGSSGVAVTSITSGGTQTPEGSTVTIMPDEPGTTGRVIGGTEGDDTVTFEDGGEIEIIASIDLLGGTDRVVLRNVDENLDIPNLQNVEQLDIELIVDNLEIDLQDIGSEANNVIVDANESYDFTVENADAVDKITVKDAGDETATVNEVADQSTIRLQGSEDLVVAMRRPTDNELTVAVSSITNADITLDINVDDLTISSVGSDWNRIANITANSATTLELTGSQDLEIEGEIGTGGLARISTISAAAAEGDLRLTLNGTSIETVTLGDGGDNLTIDGTDNHAEIRTGNGNDDVTINHMVNSGIVDTGSGADDITLNDALEAGGRIDGGSGLWDKITLNANVTAGTVMNVEVVNIGSVTVDLSTLLGETDVNVLAGNTAIIHHVGPNEVDVGAFAKLAIVDTSFGTALNFDALGSVTLDIDDAAVTTLQVDLGNGGTLTFDQDIASTSNATPNLTKITLTSAGDVVLVEDGSATALTATAVARIDASGVNGTLQTSNIGAVGNSFTALVEYIGASGADTLIVSSSQGSYTLNAGDDTIVFDAMTGGVDVYGGAGKDTVTLQSGGTLADDVHFVSSADFAVTVQAGAATAVGTYDVVQNFETTHDEIDLTALNLSGDQSAGTGNVTIAEAVADMTDGTNTSVELVNAGGGAGIEYVVVNLDGINFGVIDVSGVVLTKGDIEI